MKAIAMLMLVASSAIVPCAFAGEQRDRVAANMEALAIKFCQRAMNAQNDTDILAVEVTVNGTLNIYKQRIEATKSAYELRKKKLGPLINARDNAEYELIAHGGSGGRWDTESLRLKLNAFTTGNLVIAEEIEIAKLRREYTKAVATAYAVAEVMNFVLHCLDVQRMVLQKQTQAGGSRPPAAQPPGAGPPPAAAGDIVRCASSEGPFRCTGQFPATWQLTCSRAAANDSGPAMLLLYPDGTAQAQFTSRIAGNRIDPVVGRIGPDGSVLVERSDDVGGRYRWQGRFMLQAPVPGVVKPAGGATMSYRGGPMDCDGHFTLQ